MTNTPWVTNLEVSKRIRELIGEQESAFVHATNDMQFKPECYQIVYTLENSNWQSGFISQEFPRAFTLSELPPILKKICKDRALNGICQYCGKEQVPVGHPDFKLCCQRWADGIALAPWFYHFRTVAELVALGEEEKAQDYLTSILN